MRILLSHSIAKRFVNELRRAGNREIGGLLLGEHVGEEVFRIADITIQRTGGSAAAFMRNPEDHNAELAAFFAKSGAEYTRFNYLGEWHSHPGFDTLPSSKDLRSMQRIVEDPNVGANFLVLLILSLAGKRTLSASALAFCPGTTPIIVQIRKDSGIA